MGIIRLQKYLSECGYCSRRKAEEFIKLGKVKVNGNVVVELGVKVDSEKDKISVGDQFVRISQNKLYVMLHKPRGIVTTLSDEKDRRTVIDCFKGEITERIFPVGRLDYDTEGLLILTNDGDLTYTITHPKHVVEKEYIAKVEGNVSETKMDKLRVGLNTSKITTLPCHIDVLRADAKNSTVRIVITEGKNRQVRKMFESVGYQVLRLKRVRIGEILLGDLKSGGWRYLTSVETKWLKGL